MQDVEILGGCPTMSKQVGSSPIIVDSRESTKTIPLTSCPICGGELRFGSRDPCEGDFYWCESCGDGPICFPLYGGPKPTKKIADIIDADMANNALRIAALLRSRP